MYFSNGNNHFMKIRETASKGSCFEMIDLLKSYLKYFQLTV